MARRGLTATFPRAPRWRSRNAPGRLFVAAVVATALLAVCAPAPATLRPRHAGDSPRSRTQKAMDTTSPPTCCRRGSPKQRAPSKR